MSRLACVRVKTSSTGSFFSGLETRGLPQKLTGDAFGEDILFSLECSGESVLCERSGVQTLGQEAVLPFQTYSVIVFGDILAAKSAWTALQSQDNATVAALKRLSSDPECYELLVASSVDSSMLWNVTRSLPFDAAIQPASPLMTSRRVAVVDLDYLFPLKSFWTQLATKLGVASQPDHASLLKGVSLPAATAAVTAVLEESKAIAHFRSVTAGLGQKVVVLSCELDVVSQTLQAFWPHAIVAVGAAVGCSENIYDGTTASFDAVETQVCVLRDLLSSLEIDGPKHVVSLLRGDNASLNAEIAALSALYVCSSDMQGANAFRFKSEESHILSLLHFLGLSDNDCRDGQLAGGGTTTTVSSGNTLLPCLATGGPAWALLEACAAARLVFCKPLPGGHTLMHLLVSSNDEDLVRKQAIAHSIECSPSSLPPHRPQYVVTAFTPSPALPPAFLAALFAHLRDSLVAVTSMRTLSSAGLRCIELHVSAVVGTGSTWPEVAGTGSTWPEEPSGAGAEQLRGARKALVDVGSEFKVDVQLQANTVFQRVKRVMVCDMDSTLAQGEVIDELAKLCKVEDQVKVITAAAMNGELDFTGSLKSRVRLLKGSDQGIFETVRAGLKLMPGAVELCGAMRALGVRLCVASGGFVPVARHVQKVLRLHYCFANEVEILADGSLSGELLPDAPIVNAQRKEDILRQLSAEANVGLHQAVTCGDGANDLLMLHAAGLGIAYCAKPKVQAEATFLNNTGDLRYGLYFLGLTDADIAELLAC